MLIAYIVQFFRLTLDYHGTRKLQFEDDEYYYYVTAVPKIKVAAVDKTVTRIVPDEDDENQDLRHYVKELEEELNKMYDKFDDNHRMTNTMYNEYMNNKEKWKNIREYMEEKDGLYYEERS